MEILYIVYIFKTPKNFLIKFWHPDQNFNRTIFISLCFSMLATWSNCACANCDYSLVDTICEFSNIKFLSIWVFFGDYSRFPGQQGKRESSSSFNPLYHLFHLLPRHLSINLAATANSSPLHIATSSRTSTGNFWFPSTNR